MTTAHRPTWHPTVGGKDQGGNRVLVPSKQYSSKDLPGHTVLKYRQPGQGTSEELSKKDFKQELLNKEKNYFKEKYKEIDDSGSDSSVRHRSRSRSRESSLNSHRSENSQDYGKRSESNEKKKKFDEGSDSEEGENSKECEKSDDSGISDSESDFSEEEIRKELEKIKAERAEQARVRRELEEQQLRDKYKEDLLKGNPLMDTAPGFELKKKWTEETIFKNQSRTEPAQKHRFVNDTLRSDFHRKILSRTIM